jgi:hypothetical protein
MRIAIKRIDGTKILSGDYPDIKTAVEDCARKGVSLKGAHLAGAHLAGAYLAGAMLRDANLRDANLRGANLRNAYLRHTDLFCANLIGADLRGADLQEAYLLDADLSGASLPYFQLCPEERAFVGYKKLRNGLIATIEIPTDVPRTSSLVGRDCRAQSARVLSIEAPDGTKVLEGISIHDKNFLYRTGETVSVPDYDPDIRVECTQGVHFFMTKEEARKY